MPTRRRLLRATAAVSVPSWAVAKAAPDGQVSLKHIANQLQGRIVMPDDPSYTQSRRVASWNTRFERSPAAIVECTSHDDVRLALELASATNLEIAVRSGGHDVLGASTGDGLVIDLQRMASIEWRGDSIRVGGGVRVGQLDAATGTRNRVIPLACNRAVGVSGLTLGGGLGWFVGLYGAACDAVERATVVTPQGDVVETSSTDNPDLFWGIRGGGGNFGIVTEWQYSTYGIDTVTSGTIVYSGTQAREFLQLYRDFKSTCPDNVTVEVVAQAHTHPIIAATLVVVGTPNAARKVLKPLLDFGPPLADDLSTTTFREAGRQRGDSVRRYFMWKEPMQLDVRRTPGSYWQGITLESLDDKSIDVIADAISAPPPGWSFGLGHVMRGALTGRSDSATPFVRCEGHTTVHFDGAWSYAALADPLMTWIDESIAQLKPHAASSQYVNYLSDGSPSAVRHTYANHYNRLRQIKQRYDPANLLRGNRNIPLPL